MLTFVLHIRQEQNIEIVKQILILIAELISRNIYFHLYHDSSEFIFTPQDTGSRLLFLQTYIFLVFLEFVFKISHFFLLTSR